MSTIIRPELSEKNPYWIGKHRYYELKHFCLQYPSWKKSYLGLNGLKSREVDLASYVKGSRLSDPTMKLAESLLYFSERIKMVDDAAMKTDTELCDYILRGVTEGLSYTCLRTKYNIPCSRDVYYDAYRRFFWILSKSRE